MNDELRQPRLEGWFSDREVAPQNVREGVAQVMTEVPQTRQHGRWLALPLHRPKATSNTPTATDTIEYQPSPVPATNGHAPTVIGRTQSMLSPAKALTAGAIIAAVGGAFLIAQPFDQKGSVPGAAMDVEPVAFTARFGPGGQVRTQTYEAADGQPDDGRMLRRGAAWATTVLEVSDPRLDGTMTLSNDEDHYPGPDGPESFVAGASTYRIVTDEGAWEGSVPYFFAGEDTGGSTLVLVGEGAYDGLYAIADVSDWNDVTGVILPASPPAPPDPPRAE